MTPSARSLAWLREQGYEPARVEYWNPFSHRRVDLYGIIDLVAIKPGELGVLGVQATTTEHIWDRKQKAFAEPRLKLWLATGNAFCIHGWAKRGKPKRWTLTQLVLTRADFEDADAETQDR